MPRVAGRWLRLLLLIAGDVERNPGPRNNKQRGELDLATGFHSITAKRMQKCLTAFETWVEDELGLDFSDVIKDAEGCGLSLRAYGLHLYRIGVAAIHADICHHFNARPLPTIPTPFGGRRGKLIRSGRLQSLVIADQSSLFRYFVLPFVWPWCGAGNALLA